MIPKLGVLNKTVQNVQILMITHDESTISTNDKGKISIGINDVINPCGE